MKKSFILSLTFLLCLAVPAFANAPASASNYVKLKNLSNQYIQTMLNDERTQSNKLLNEMGKLGATDFHTTTYAQCPYRGYIKIDGKSIYAKNKRCAVLKYKYKTKEFETGKCTQ